MALMLGSLYDALVSVAVDPDKARKAAEEAAGYKNRITKVETDLTLLKWMIATNIVLTFGVLTAVVPMLVRMTR
jgi:hypothetical protein